MQLIRVYTLEEGKYIIECDGGSVKALRYGELWRDLTGDKLIGALLAENDELRSLVENAIRTIENATKAIRNAQTS